jgi:DNA-binding CsgD family transcriptional regulator
MQSIHRLLGGHAAFHIIAAPSTGVVALSEQVGADPVANELYLEYYSQKEVRIPPALAHGVGDVVTEEMLLDRKAYEGSEIYGDLLLPYDIPHIMAVWLQRTSCACQALVVEAGIRHGPFQQQALEKFSALVPHLIRAARMREALVTARRDRDIRIDILDRLPLGVVFLDDKGVLIAASAYAEQILREGHGLRIRQSRLQAEFPEDARRLEDGLLRSGRRGGIALPGTTLALRRRPPKSPLNVVIVPVVSSPVLTISPQPAAMLVVTDPDRTPKARAEIIREALHLTEAESRLAAVLFTGATLREAAELLGKSFHTCKTQLKSIYAKTGCSSHIELTKKLLFAAVADRIAGYRSG